MPLPPALAKKFEKAKNGDDEEDEDEEDEDKKKAKKKGKMPSGLALFAKKKADED